MHVDTNMLIEAWHALLKIKFMNGQRNRRMDNLIYLLVDVGMYLRRFCAGLS